MELVGSSRRDTRPYLSIKRKVMSTERKRKREGEKEERDPPSKRPRTEVEEEEKRVHIPYDQWEKVEFERLRSSYPTLARRRRRRKDLERMKSNHLRKMKAMKSHIGRITREMQRLDSIDMPSNGSPSPCRSGKKESYDQILSYLHTCHALISEDLPMMQAIERENMYDSIGYEYTFCSNRESCSKLKSERRWKDKGGVCSDCDNSY